MYSESSLDLFLSVEQVLSCCFKQIEERNDGPDTLELLHKLLGITRTMEIKRSTVSNASES